MFVISWGFGGTMGNFNLKEILSIVNISNGFKEKKKKIPL